VIRESLFAPHRHYRNGVPHAIPIRSPSDSDMIRAAFDLGERQPALSPTEDRP
jgi:hypothetical protein